jgi:sulfur relay (sulfurtransferase) DsrC/TusE family protein
MRFSKHLAMLMEERDRRYTEVGLERDKALKVKEQGDATALVLAAENQRLRDDVHNNVLNFLRDDRNTYATREEIKPLVAFMQSQQGAKSGIDEVRTDSTSSRTFIIGIVAAATAAMGLFVAVAAIAATVAVAFLTK